MKNSQSHKPTLAGCSQLETDPWQSPALALRNELSIDLREVNGRLVAFIEDPIRSRFFQVGHREYQFIMLLDGNRRLPEIVELMQQHRGFPGFDAATAKTICQWLSNSNLLDTPTANRTDQIRKAAQAKANQKFIAFLNPVSFRINLINPDRSLKRITPYLQHFFSSWMFIIWALLGAYAWSLIITDYDRFCNASVGILASDRWLWLFVIWVGLKLIHETAHGVACQKYGGEVPEAGILMLLFAPLAYVNVTSSWRFSNRTQRLVVSAAGMYAELLVAFIAIIVWAHTESLWLADLSYQIVIMAGISTLLFNANPLLRFDGYYLLADTLGIVNLYGKGQAWFGDRMRHFAFGFPLDNDLCSERELRWVATYGLCSFVWRIMLCTSLLLVASTLFGGAGLVLALIGGIFWVWLPLRQHLRQIKKAAQKQPIDRLRFASVTAGFVTVILVCFFGLHAPEITRAPAIVQFNDEQIIRASSEGFLREIHVRNGQPIRAGQRMLRIENPNLEHELRTLKQARESARIQARIHRRQNQISLEQAELANIDSLNQQIVEMQNKVSQLEVLAPFDGVVYRRGLANMKGSYVKQGEMLMHFADPRKKKILMSIDEEQFKTVQIKCKTPVRFIFSGVEIVSSQLDSIDPQASDVPIDPSMTAYAGGELAVRQAENASEEPGTDAYRLVYPQFVGKSELGPAASKSLQAGQLGTAFLHGRKVSLGGYFLLRFKNWIRNKLTTGIKTRL